MNSTYRVLAGVCLVFLAVSVVYAADVELNADIGAKVTSSYVRRGYVINEDPCFQPFVTLTSGDFSLNVWGTWDLDRTTNSSQRTRVDVTLDYTRVINRHIISGGFVAYIYHDSSYTESGKDTFEAFLEYTLDVALLPSVAINYDFGEIEGFYMEMSTGHSVELVKDIADMDFRVAAGLADENHCNALFNQVEGMPGKTAFVDATASVSIPVQIGESMVVTPSVVYMTLIDSEIRDAVDAAGLDTSHLSYSVSLAYTF